MTTQEKISVLLLLGAIAVTYSWAGAIVLGALWRRVRGAPAAGRGPVARWVRRGVLVLAAVGVVCAAYARFVEPWWLGVSRVELRSPKLPAAARPVRIVHLSDLHCDPTARLEERLPDVVAELKPDLIAFTGDAINSEAGLYRVKHTWLYVSRGIGMEGSRAPRVRFCSRPEVTLITIEPAAPLKGTALNDE